MKSEKSQGAGLAIALAVAAPASAQSFVGGTGKLPAVNAGFSENVEFLDADLDGDFDVVVANGGSFGNQRNRLWINQGGAQGGLLGVFEDETYTRMPAGQDASRDVDFVDVDLDGDQDLFVSNSSGVANQTNRWLINMGGAQGGTTGYFADETSTRWVNLGVNDGTSAFSSIAPSLVVSTGGFVDWSCDSVLADLDGDGYQDLIQSTYGALSSGRVPTRIFLNDGAGVYEEFNPSGFQLGGSDILNGDPALWCEGTHVQDTTNTTGLEADIAHDTLSVEVGDLDGDFDVDLLCGEKFQFPRLYRNLSDGGGLGFRDVSYAVMPPGWALGPGNYEQELGDLDEDGDLDIYGVNWRNIDDVQIHNNGDGTFVSQLNVFGSSRMNEADWIDYDGDGDLDVFVVGEEADHQIMENPGPEGGWVLADAPGVVPVLGYDPSHGGDVCDVDDDGDYDYLAACLHEQPARLYLNASGEPDVHAPRVPHVEALPARVAGPEPSVVRAQVYDNAPWYLVGLYETTLVYRVDEQPFLSLPMTWSGGQVFRGEIPGNLTGVVAYQVRAVDRFGNTGISAIRTYPSGPCTGAPETYCTAGVTASGCQAVLSSTGAPSASAAGGFLVSAANVEGNKDGTFFYGLNGAQAGSWGNGSSFRCIASPVRRVGFQEGVGTPGQCDGTFQRDLNAFWTAAPPPRPGAGEQVHLQLWFRDPLSTSNQPTSLSDGLIFSVCP